MISVIIAVLAAFLSYRAIQASAAVSEPQPDGDLRFGPLDQWWAHRVEHGARVADGRRSVFDPHADLLTKHARLLADFGECYRAEGHLPIGAPAGDAPLELVERVRIACSEVHPGHAIQQRRQFGAFGRGQPHGDHWTATLDELPQKRR